MRLAKISAILIILIIGGYSVTWYYLAYKLNKNIIANYPDKQITYNFGYKEHNLQFTSVIVSGFPFKLQATLNGFSEETDIEKIIYKNPLIIGYDILDNKIFIQYNGQIKAVFKPLISGFGSMLDVKDYEIVSNLAWSTELYTAIINEQNIAKIILSNIDNIKISSGAVKIADLTDNQVFYSTKYEELEVSFIPRQKYDNLNDFYNNLPTRSNITYKVKTDPVKTEIKRIVPDILLYIWQQLPDDFEFYTKLNIATKAEKLVDVIGDVNITGEISIQSHLMDLQIKHLDYNASTANSKITLQTNAKFKFKDMFFDKLFTYHRKYRSHLNIISQEKRDLNNKIEYIKNHQDLFRLDELKNVDYNLAIDAAYQNVTGNIELKIADFAINSENIGFRIINSNFSSDANGDELSGTLYLQNYKDLINFCANFTYELHDNTRYLQDHEKKLLADTTLDLLKYISDHNKSSAKDLSIKYDFNKDDSTSTFGKVQLNSIGTYHRLLLYLKIIGKIPKTGDILENMQKYAPNIIIDPKLLAKLLTKDGTLKKEFENLLQNSDKLLQKLEANK